MSAPPPHSNTSNEDNKSDHPQLQRHLNVHHDRQGSHYSHGKKIRINSRTYIEDFGDYRITHHSPRSHHRSRSCGTRSHRSSTGSSTTHGYNPVRLNTTVYSGSPASQHRVQFHHGLFTWRMNSNILERRSNDNIPGYNQYLRSHAHASLPFACWLLLCCGLCIPCCCFCCDYCNDIEDDITDKKRKQSKNIMDVDDTKPLLKEKNKKDKVILYPISDQHEYVPKIQPVSNMAYSSYQSVENGQSINA